VAFAPPIQRFRPTHWWSAALAVALTIVFAILLKDSLHYAVDAAEPGLQQLEQRQPK
jgi:hypothetical protein